MPKIVKIRQFFLKLQSIMSRSLFETQCMMPPFWPHEAHGVHKEAGGIYLNLYNNIPVHFP